MHEATAKLIQALEGRKSPHITLFFHKKRSPKKFHGARVRVDRKWFMEELEDDHPGLCEAFPGGHFYDRHGIGHDLDF